MFDKNDFINKNSEFLYNKLQDFLNTEINVFSFEHILFLLNSENIRMFEYEGNQYIILKSKNANDILIYDEVSEKHGVKQNKTRFYLNKDVLIYLINYTINSK